MTRAFAALPSAGAPNAVGDPAGYLFAAQNTQHVIYRAADHHIHELWWDADGWHHHDPTGDNDAPNAAGDPAGYVVDTECTQHIVYRSDDQHIYELLWTADAGWSHNDLTMAAAGAPNAVGDPVGYLFAAQNTQHVIYRATDHHIHELWKDASGWHHHDPTGDNGAPDAVSDPAGYVFAAQGTEHIIYRRKDGHLMELWWIDGNWSHKDVTVEALQNS